MTAGTYPLGLTLGGGQFRLERFIASGAMGEVYEASSKDHGRVALKLLRPELARDDEWSRRFEREWLVARAIESPYVARVLSAGRSGKTQSPWIAFELLKGEPLESAMHPVARLPLPRVAQLVEHMLLGLEAAHAAGVIHRDIKPGNLFVEADSGRLRILDFGIAKIARTGAQTSGLTKMDHTLGTPAYMSPEQLRNAKDVDERTDVYGAGCVAFRLLSGKVPFEHRDPGMMRILRESGEPPSLASASHVTWPDAMQGWIDLVLSFDRARRFGTARAALTAWRFAVEAMGSFEQTRTAGPVDADTDVSSG